MPSAFGCPFWRLRVHDAWCARTVGWCGVVICVVGGGGMLEAVSLQGGIGYLKVFVRGMGQRI